MAIDSVRLLTDSAAQLWRRLSAVHTLEPFGDAAYFDDWLGTNARLQLDLPEEQALRRDYRLLTNLIVDLEALVHSREQAVARVRAQAATDLTPEQDRQCAPA